MLVSKRTARSFFLLTIVILVLSGITAFNQYQKSIHINKDILETYQTFRAANQSLLSINQAALEVAIFLGNKDPEIINKLPVDIISAQLNFANLKQLIQDSPKELATYQKLEPLFNQKIAFLQEIQAQNQAGNTARVAELFADKNRLQLTNSIVQLIIDIKHVEQEQLRHFVHKYQVNQQRADTFFVMAGSLNVILLLISFVFVRRYLEE